MNTTPPEILASIFGHAVSAEDQTYRNPNLDDDLGYLTIYPERNRTPLLLTEVCKTWNTVANSTPSLWTCIAFDLALVTSERQANRLEHWLRCSGSLLVDLNFQYHYLRRIRTAKYNSLHDDFFDVTLKEIHRWRSAIVEGAVFGKAGSPVMKNLRWLTLVDATPDCAIRIPSISSFLPSVESLDLQAFPNAELPYNLESPPHDGLHYLKMNVASGDFRVLCTTPNLERCHLWFTGQPAKLVRGETPIVLQNLRELCVQGSSHGGFLSAIIAPKVNYLSVTDRCPLVNVLNVTSHASLSLTKLILEGVDFTTAELVVIVDQVPKLESLWMAVTRDVSDFVPLLDPRAHPCRLPVLRYLSLNPGFGSLGLGPIAEIAELRSRLSHLRDLRLSDSDEWESDYAELKRLLLAQGIVKARWAN